MNKRFYIIELVGEEEGLDKTTQKVQKVLEKSGLKKATITEHEPKQE